MTRVVIIVGSRGRGSNMQSIVDDLKDYSSAVVAGVVAPKADSPALLRASEQDIPTAAFDYRAGDDSSLDTAVRQFSPGLICLAGYMKQLTFDFVSKWHGRIMNIHPSLIPMFCGKGMYGHFVHKAAIEYGVKYSGCTVHFVDENYDTGPIIGQSIVPVLPDDDADTLAARILIEEHKLYPHCVKLFAEDRLKLEGRHVRVRLDKSPVG